MDGGQHYSEEGKVQDRIRDNYMTNGKLTVLRFSDKDVFKNMNGVVEEIWKYL